MTPQPPQPAEQPRVRPMVLFGLLSVLTFAGPLAIIIIGRGGRRTTWPPDRPVEWWVFLVVTIGFVGLFLACVIDATLTLRRSRRDRGHADAPGDRGRPPGRDPEVGP